MGPFRKLLLVGVGVLALHGVQACSNDETSLNPQPLPPEGQGTNDPTQSPPADGKNAGGGSGGGDTTSGAGGTPPAPAASPDAGWEGGDAADGGDG